MSAARKLRELDELLKDIPLSNRVDGTATGTGTKSISRKPRATRGPTHGKLLKLTDGDHAMLAALAEHWELNESRTIREAVRRAFNAAGLSLPATATSGGAKR